MKKHFPIFLFIAITFFATSLFSQTDTVINGKHYKLMDDKKVTETDKSEVKKKLYPLDSLFLIGNKKFTYYNNWITFGAGKQKNLSYGNQLGFTGGADFNFHLQHHYFQTGLIITGQKYKSNENYQFHFGYGKRYEDKDYHFAIFAGISYSRGYKKTGENDTTYSKQFNVPGLYAQAEVIKKITYDVGVGGSFYIDYNKEQSIVGARFILYFSSAYKGKKFYDGKDPD